MHKRIWCLYITHINRGFPQLENENGLSYWQNRLFIHIITYFLPFSTITLSLGIMMSIMSGLYCLATVELFTFLTILFVTFSNINISARKTIFVVAVHLIACILLYFLGSLGPGMLYLLAGTFFTVLIFPPRCGWCSTAAIAAICITFAVAFYFGLIYTPVSKQYSVMSWVTVSSNAVVLSGLITMLLPRLFRKLERTSARYEVVAMATSDTIYDWNITDGRVEFNSGLNTTFGYSVAEIKSDNRWWINNLHPADKFKVLKGFINILANKDQTNLQIEHRLICADGTYKHVYNRVAVVRDKFGKPVRLIGAIQDTTKLRKYISAIETQNASLQEIAWIQSHKVRSPLATILGLLPLVDKVEVTNKESIVALEGIKESCLHLDAVVREITDLSLVTITPDE